MYESSRFKKSRLPIIQKEDHCTGLSIYLFNLKQHDEWTMNMKVIYILRKPTLNPQFVKRVSYLTATPLL